MKGVIINLAPTGIVPTRAMSPHVPITVPEIVADVKRCAALGVSMVHLHARDDAGKPTYKREIYARMIGEIRTACPELVICVSLSGRNFGTFEQRADPLTLTGDLKPDMGSLTLSSMNFARTASLNEPDMVGLLAQCMLDAEIKPELEVFDTGMVNYACYLLEKGLIKAPLYFNVLLGNVATAQAKPAALGLITSELPPGSFWCGAGMGATQVTMNAMGLLFGHGVRTGLEDNLWFDPERTRPTSNADMVERVVEMATMFGKPVASAREVRTALGLPGRT